MKTEDLVMIGINNLRRRKLRTFLTALGVVIGTASIVVMVSLGLGQTEVTKQMIESYGSLTTVTVRAESYYGDNTKSKTEPLRLTDKTIEEIRRMPHVKGLSPILEAGVILIQGKYVNTSVNLQGVNEEYLKNIDLAAGHLPQKGGGLSILYGNQIIRYFQDSKSKAAWDWDTIPDVDLVNKTIFVVFDQDKYYQAQSGGKDEKGQPITSPKKYNIPTAGVIAGDLNTYNMYSFNAYCEIEELKTLLRRIYKKNQIPGQPTNRKGKPYPYFVYSSAEVYVDDMDHVQEVMDSLVSQGYQADSNMSWLESSQKSMQSQQALLGGIGAVSLLVAAIGIANTMMMSINERTREIGILKVLGLNMSRIRDMFLIESAFIGLTGGLGGLLISYAISFLINHFSSNSSYMGGISVGMSIIPLWLAAGGVGFAILAAVVAGFFPARRAMKMSPLSAIRAQ